MKRRFGMIEKCGHFPRSLCRIAAALLSVLGVIGCIFQVWGKEENPSAVPSALEEVAEVGENRYTCQYEGISHDFIVDLPDECAGAPLVLMLHGYGQNAERFRADTEFEKTANPAGYAVVYVGGAPDPDDRTSAAGWNSGIGDSKKRDAEFLTALAEYLQKEYGTDAKRTCAVGFSNGAFMAHRLAAEAGGTFRAVVSVAGMMPLSVWENRPSACGVSVFQVTGEKDDVVPKKSDGSADAAIAPAIEDVMEYWAGANGLASAAEEAVGKKSVLKKYGDSSADAQVWHLIVGDGRHSWPEETVTGFDMNAMIVDFLDCVFDPAPESSGDRRDSAR